MKEKARRYTPSPIPRLEDAFLTTYILLLEHDSLNHRHLVDAGLPTLLHKYIAERLHRGPNDYPAEDTCNVLAVALFSHLTSQDTLNGESNDSWNKVIDILLPLTFAWFRYTFMNEGFDSNVLVHGGGPSSRLSSPTHSPVHPSPLTVPIDYMGHGFGLRLPAAIISRTWTPVCDCHRGGWKCDGEVDRGEFVLPPVLYIHSLFFIVHVRPWQLTKPSSLSTCGIVGYVTESRCHLGNIILSASLAYFARLDALSWDLTPFRAPSLEQSENEIEGRTQEDHQRVDQPAPEGPMMPSWQPTRA